MHRPSKNLVIAAETLPALYRPSNQARLVRAHAANPGPSDPGAMLPGVGEVQLGNGIHSNGLLSGSADRRFAATIASLREKQERSRQIALTGSPNAPSRPRISASMAQALQALPAAPAAPGSPTWEHVDTLQRPNGTRWVITRIKQPYGWRYAVSLYRTRGDSDDQIVRSDNLADERSAREYIRAYEVRRGDFGAVGHPRRVGFWAGILRKGADAPGMNGLGELATQPLVLGALAIGALYFIHKTKRA